ncbi:MAG: hypothetical protein ACI92I_000409 [Acidimicrobiales bacterium]|jgi:hypothetical protein
MALTATVSVSETDTAYGNIVTNVDVQTEVIASTEAVVREYFSDIPVMIQVARCESTFRHTLTDGTVLRGHVDDRDTGVMQINTYYHGDTADTLGFDLENIYDNMAYARDLYERQGTQPWSASWPCWGRTLASA